MATTKKTTDETVTVNVNPATEEKVKIRLPLNKDDRADVFVSVNERTWLIKRGVEVEVPKCVAEVLEHQEQAEAVRYDYEDANRHD